jgi:DNA topoisomerase-2
MILVNGTNGIGTGYRTDIPCYNPKDLTAYLRSKLLNDIVGLSGTKFIPYYEGFTGTIREISATKFLVKGTYIKHPTLNDTIIVTELPVGVWTQNFNEYLDGIISPEKPSTTTATTATTVKKKASKSTEIVVPIVDYTIDPSDIKVHCVIKFAKGKLAELEAQQTEYEDCNGVDKLLKLYNTITTNNMNAFDSNDRLRNYETVNDIIDEYYDVRLEHYEKRKMWLINTIEKELILLSNRAKFILENVEGTIDLRRKRMSDIEVLLETKKYSRIDDKYDYLTNMSLINLSKEKMERLINEKNEKEMELAKIQATTITDFWLNELTVFEIEYDKYLILRKNNDIIPQKKKAPLSPTNANANVTVRTKRTK